MNNAYSIASRFLWLALAGFASALTFVHPGARSSQYELDFVKAKIATGAQPWTSHLNQAKYAGSDSRALGAALNWYYTGDVASANTAITTLTSWNTHAAYEPPPDNQGNQSSLEGAWAASVLAPAAEIMSLYPGWSATDKAATQAMFRRVFLPAMLKMSYWNGNVDLTQIDALLSIAVFLDDTTSFKIGIDRLSKRLPAYFYLTSDAPAVRNYGGSSDFNWGNYNPVLQWVDGLSQETCRDNGHHAQFAIAAALAALETAYLQGVDLYTPNQERMVDAMELIALQLSSRDMQGTCPGTTTNQHGNDDRYNILEIGYNHYHNRKGIAMPQTLIEINKELRATGKHQFNIFHETLTHGDIEYGGVTHLDDSHHGDSDLRASMSFQPDGSLEIMANGDAIYALTVYGADGSRLAHSDSRMEPGTTQSLNLAARQVTGMVLVRALTSNGPMMLKAAH